MLYETLLVGILVALFFSEVMELYPGGIIVPAYFALYLDQPSRVLSTLCIAFLSLIVFRAVSGKLILFGKRRFVFFILIAVTLAQLWSFVFPMVLTVSVELQVIGWVIPGLLANTLEKQRIFPTLASLSTVSVATFFFIRILEWILG